MKSKRGIIKGLLFCSVILIVIAGFINSATATTYYCNSCNDCENKINSALEGDTVMLTSEIINHAGRCITWKNSNLEFDCQGYLIGGSGKKEGIYVENRFNNTIKNCVIIEFSVGIDIWNSSSILINNTVSSNAWIGILFRHSSGSILTNNTVSSNMEDGVYLLDTNSSIITNNTVSSNKRYGIYLSESSSNTIIENTVTSNWYGASLQHSSGNTITDNIIHSNERGILLWDYSNSNIINSNSVCSNSDLDLYLNSSSENQGSGNICNKTEGWNDEGTINCTYPCYEVNKPSPLISDIEIAAIILILTGIIAMVVYRIRGRTSSAKKISEDKMQVVTKVTEGKIMPQDKKEELKETGSDKIPTTAEVQGEKIVTGKKEEEVKETDVDKIWIIDEIQRERVDIEKKREELRRKRAELERKKSMLKK